MTWNLDPVVVVKVGGSLFDLPDLGTRLAAWLKTVPSRWFVLTAGGGGAANFIREMDRVHELGEEKSHWLALRTLGVTAQLLEALVLPSLPVCVVHHHGLRLPLWAQGGIPLVDLYAFAEGDDCRPHRLPHCWNVTSDSLAARVAEVIRASELILLKSVTIPPDMVWAEASRRGYVDGYFPTMIARGIKARAVNFREWRP